MWPTRLKLRLEEGRFKVEAKPLDVRGGSKKRLRKAALQCAFLVAVLLPLVCHSVFSLSLQHVTISASGTIGYLSPIFDSFLFGVGPEEWNTLGDLNKKYDVNMKVATCWINSRYDLYGWWTESFFPQTLWNMNRIPHIITWGYFTHSWNITDYSAYNLSRYRQAWLNDLAYMAGRLKAPSDGKHLVLVSLETEFNCYKNMNYTYWNQLMIDSRSTIREIAPNVLVSYSIGGWAWRWGDVSMNGALITSMQQMDFMSFQSMWGAYGDSQTRWMNGDDLKTNYEGVNWVKKFGDKPHIWDYMIEDIINNVKALRKYNEHIFLSHFAIDHHLWGLQSQVDVINALSSNIQILRELGLFGISWMHYRDSRWDEWAYWPGDIGACTGGYEYPDGSGKPCLPLWVSFVNLNTET